MTAVSADLDMNLTFLTFFADARLTDVSILGGGTFKEAHGAHG